MSDLIFSSTVFKLGINPCVDVPEDVLHALFAQAGKDKGPIPVKGSLNGREFRQTLVKYSGSWRLYLNAEMRRAAKIDVGDHASVIIAFDPEPRIEVMPPSFASALAQNEDAKVAFAKLVPSHQKEILRYLNFMKSEEALARNIEKVVQYLLGHKNETP